MRVIKIYVKVYFPGLNLLVHHISAKTFHGIIVELIRVAFIDQH